MSQNVTCNDKSLEQPTRKRIYGHLVRCGEKGSYFSEMKTELNLAIGQVQHHLGVLERAGYVRKDGKNYYVIAPSARAVGKEPAVIEISHKKHEEKILSDPLKNSSIRREMYGFINDNPDGVSHSDIHDVFADVNIGYHLRTLRERGLVLNTDDGYVSLPYLPETFHKKRVKKFEKPKPEKIPHVRKYDLDKLRKSSGYANLVRFPRHGLTFCELLSEVAFHDSEVTDGKLRYSVNTLVKSGLIERRRMKVDGTGHFFYFVTDSEDSGKEDPQKREPQNLNYRKGPREKEVDIEELKRHEIYQLLISMRDDDITVDVGEIGFGDTEEDVPDVGSAYVTVGDIEGALEHPLTKPQINGMLKKFVDNCLVGKERSDGRTWTFYALSDDEAEYVSAIQKKDVEKEVGKMSGGGFEIEENVSFLYANGNPKIASSWKMQL
jgi:DNA-binding transcriptional ArsR family regulator